MSGTNEDPKPPAGDTPPGDSVDVTALQQQLADLAARNAKAQEDLLALTAAKQEADQKVAELTKTAQDLQTARGGAQTAAHKAKEELQATQADLTEINNRLAEQERIAAEALETSQKLQAEADKARKDAMVLREVGLKDPDLVPLVADGVVTITGENSEEVQASIDKALAHLSKLRGPAHEPEPTAPVTPPISLPRGFEAQIPVVDTTGAELERQIAEINSKRVAIASSRIPDMQELSRLDAELAALRE